MDPSTELKEGYPKIILFGDSLTERSFDVANKGFGATLQNYYARRADVVNRGFSGFFLASVYVTFGPSRSKTNSYNTRWLLPHFDTIVRQLQGANSSPPLFFTIFLGANDAILPKFSQHVPLPEYEANLRYYVDILLAHPMTKGTKIILITPPPIDILPSTEDEVDIPALHKQPSHEPFDIGYQTWLNKKKYAEKVMEIAKSYEGHAGTVAGLDFWTAMINYGRVVGKENGTVDDEKPPGSGLPGAVYFGREVFLDGLHLGPLGYDVLSNELLSLLTTKWPELRKESIPLQAPWWGDLPQATESDEVAERREMDERNAADSGAIQSRWLL